jgi:hypothetical protein
MNNRHSMLNESNIKLDLRVAESAKNDKVWRFGTITEVNRWSYKLTFDDGEVRAIRSWDLDKHHGYFVVNDTFAMANEVAEAVMLINVLHHSQTLLLNDPVLCKAVLALQEHIPKDEADDTLSMLRACGAGGRQVYTAATILKACNKP